MYPNFWLIMFCAFIVLLEDIENKDSETVLKEALKKLAKF